jgi:hypothetical protein
MGKHTVLETVVNDDAAPPRLESQTDGTAEKLMPRKRRRIHPIRRVARLILGTGEKKKKKSDLTLADQAEGKTCHGPSRWHNLLPFLEPLFVLDPKLLFIEDHILKRPQPPQAFHRDSASQTPRNIDELRRTVEETKSPCTCDECSPKLYKISRASTHGTINDRRDRSSTFPSSYQNRRDVGLGPELKLKFHGDYEAMALVRHHIAWLDATYLHPSSRPTPSVLHLQSLLSTWSSNLAGLDMRETMSTLQLNDLFVHLNRVFFSDCVPSHNTFLTAGFSYIPDTRTECFGKSFFNPLMGTQILIHPTLYRGNSSDPRQRDYLDTRLRNRLGTVLHEMCHAYLKAYSCRSCAMHDTCIGPLGHGRAWQILAAKMEEVASVLLGGRVNMGRFPSLLRDLEGHGKVPSPHDLEAYGFGAEVGNGEQGMGG